MAGYQLNRSTAEVDSSMLDLGKIINDTLELEEDVAIGCLEYPFELLDSSNSDEFYFQARRRRLTENSESENEITPRLSSMVLNGSPQEERQSQVNHFNSNPGVVAELARASPFEIFGLIQSELELAILQLERWKENEKNKERDYMKVDPNLGEIHLNRVQQMYEGICSSLDTLSLQDQETILNRMVANLVVITKQPSCVNEERVILKKFHATVRILLGEQFYTRIDVVKATLINQSGCPVPININGAPFTLDDSTSVWKKSRLQDMEIWKADLSPSFKLHPKRLEKSHQGMKTVNDEKFWVYFEVKLNFAGHDVYESKSKSMQPISFVASATSYPVKIAVHASQYQHAWETIIWDNAAGNFGVQPISMQPNELPYKDVIQALNTRFFRVTGRPLEETDFSVIVKKLIGADFFDQIQPTAEPRMMSLANFRDEVKIEWVEDDAGNPKTCTAEMSFYGWFYHVGKFTLEFLESEHNKRSRSGEKVVRSSLWIDRKVMGYIPHRTAYAMLSTCSPGTFLLRFSAATPRAITIDFKDELCGLHSIRASSEDLKSSGLPDRIMRIPKLKFLYSSLFAESNFPKEIVFRKYNGNVHQYESPYGSSTQLTNLEIELQDLPISYVRVMLQFDIIY